MKVYVEGRLNSRPWIDRDGQARAGNEIFATEVTFLDSRASAEAGRRPAGRRARPGRRRRPALVDL